MLTSLLLTGLFVASSTDSQPFVVRQTDGQNRTLPAASLPSDDEWQSLSRGGTPRPAWPRTAQVRLANGNRIAGSFLRGDSSSLTLRADWGKANTELKVPFSAVDALWLVEPGDDLWLTNHKSDVVKLATGEVITGDLEGLQDRQLAIKVDGTSRTFPIAVVKAIGFNPALTVNKPLKGTHYHIVTASGSRLTAKALSGDGQAIAVTTSFGTKLSIPWSDVVAIDRWSDALLPLSSLKPIRTELVPYGTLKWPPVMNRSVRGLPLTLKTSRGIETFDSGIGTHAKTTLFYDLAGKYRTFEATVGLDAATGRRGTAVVQVLVDDRVVPLPKLALLTAAGGPETIRVDVSKAKSLKLVTDFGPAGDVQTDVNWVEARLQK